MLFRSIIGRGCRIGSGACIGSECRVGEGTLVEPRAVLLDRTRVGRNCILHSGCVLGCDGFGFLPSPEGPVKIPQIGGVVIGDDVEIGACTTVDRGTIGDTVVGDGTKIDNHVQIGHNVRIGRFCIVCSSRASPSFFARTMPSASICSMSSNAAALRSSILP